MNKLQELENKYNQVNQELTQAIEDFNLALAKLERLQEERAQIKKAYREELNNNNQ